MKRSNTDIKKAQTTEDLLRDPQYTPEVLLDTLIFELKLENDAELARVLGVSAPVISKVRRRMRPVLPSLLLHMYDATDLSIERLRHLMGRTDICK